MSFVQSFKPVIGTSPRVLILGSMPGVKSLEAQQYYAHPRNAFWPILSTLFNIHWAQDYGMRIAQFQELPLVLWDVLGSCYREGSLDTDIASDQLQVNPIDELLVAHPDISLVAFNGLTAEKYFVKLIKPGIPPNRSIQLVRLPSTSPAHAALKFEHKLEQWRIIHTHLQQIHL